MARRLRARVWRVADGLFPPGARVLDVGCGTGVDAWHLAARGVRVVGVDPSAAMIARARGRGDASDRPAEGAARSGAAGGRIDAPRFVVGTVPGLAAAGELGVGAFDGALSDFGALNAVPDLAELGGALSALLRPGAAVVAVVMGPLCAWETAAHLARGDLRRAARRWHRGATADLGAGAFPVRYPSPRALARALGPAFRLERALGLGLVLPPTWSAAAARLAARPRLLAAVDRLDALLCAAPASARAADHYVAVLRRRP